MQTRVGLCTVPHTCGIYGICNMVRSAIGKTVTGWRVAVLGNAGHFLTSIYQGHMGTDDRLRAVETAAASPSTGLSKL
jgi:hypothetical protein